MKFSVKKIAIVTPYFPPDTHDMALYSYHIAKELAILGVETMVIAPWSKQACASKPVGGFDVFCVPAKKGTGEIFHIQGKYYKEVLGELQKFSPDCVAVNGLTQKLSLWGAKAAKNMGVPSIAINHAFKRKQSNVKLVKTLLERQEDRMLHLIKKNRAVFAGASKANIEYLKKLGAVPRFEIPYAVENDIEPVPAVKKRMGIPDSTLLVVINLNKTGEDYNKVLSTCVEIKKFGGPDIQFAVLGEKPKDLNQEYEGIAFVGDLSDEELVSLLYGCDIYIHFVDKLSMNLDVIRAGYMKCAAICVLPDADFEFDLINDGKTGIAIKNSSDELKAAIQKLRLHTKIRTEYAQALQADAELKRGWGQSALALVDAVWELKGGRRQL